MSHGREWKLSSVDRGRYSDFESYADDQATDVEIEHDVWGVDVD
jgi:hypothetical protein